MTQGASSARKVVLVVIALLLLAGGGVAVAAGRQVASDLAFKPIPVPAPTPAASGADAVLSGLTAAPSSASASSATRTPTPDGITAAIGGLLKAPALGGAVAALVVDPATNQALYSANAAASVSPASTLKLLTAAAVLRAHKPTDRITTSVVAGPGPGDVVLVGAGDPTLSAAPSGQATRYAEAARIADLANAVRKALGPQSVTRVLVDGSLFTGPEVAPGWSPADVPTEYGARITAAMVDAGRANPSDDLRTAEPDLAAGQALAAALGGATVTRGRAAAGARVLGQVTSAPYGRLVEEMLTESDNVIAEVLGRQVALASGQPASFVGAAAAVATTLQPLGITVGAALKDTSGLSVQDRIPPGALADVLRLALDPTHPELASIVTGMPVAGWSGTLADRYMDETSAGQGVVRAKTGTLDGVSALAGVVHDRDGRDLVTVLVANRVPLDGTATARTALDAIAAMLATCGCG